MKKSDLAPTKFKPFIITTIVIIIIIIMNHEVDGNDNVKKKNDWTISKTTTLQVHQTFLYTFHQRQLHE